MNARLYLIAGTALLGIAVLGSACGGGEDSDVSQPADAAVGAEGGAGEDAALVEDAGGEADTGAEAADDAGEEPNPEAGGGESSCGPCDPDSADDCGPRAICRKDGFAADFVCWPKRVPDSMRCPGAEPEAGRDCDPLGLTCYFGGTMAICSCHGWDVGEIEE